MRLRRGTAELNLRLFAVLSELNAIDEGALALEEHVEASKFGLPAGSERSQPEVDCHTRTIPEAPGRRRTTVVVVRVRPRRHG